jgi:hypothetical protein
MRLKRRVHPQIAWAKLRARRDDREQEVVELNSKARCGINETKRESLEVKFRREMEVTAMLAFVALQDNLLP